MKAVQIIITGRYDENEYYGGNKDIADCIEDILRKWSSHTSWETQSIGVHELKKEDL